jgi:hypothetical protein
MLFLQRPAKLTLLCTMLSLPLASAALADEVVEQIELGLELYQEGDYGAALTELEFAINDIRKLMSGRLGGTFPDAPSGWSAGEVESAGGGGAAALMGGGGAMLQRNYRQEDGDGRLEASLMVDNPMVQGMAALFSNPAMVASQPNMERVRMGRESALVKWEAERGRVEATLMLDSRILMQVKGQGLDSPDVAVELLKAWDLGEVRAQAAR